MKKLLIVIVFFLGTIACVQSQEGTQEGDRQQMDVSQIIDNRVEDLTERLSLTSEQVTKVKAIYEKTLAENAEPEATSEQRHNEILDLLNAEQKEIYSDYLENRSARSFEGSQRGESETSERPQMDVSSMIESRVESLTESLSLDADQVMKIKAIYEKTLGAQMEEDGDRETLSEQRHNEIMDLLNADQKEIYKSYLEERENRQGPGERPERE